MQDTQSIWHESRWSLPKALRWVLLHGLCTAAFVWRPTIGWTEPLVLGLGIYLTMCVGVALGMHRGMIHRAFETSKTVERALVTLGVLAGLGGPLAMAKMHEYRDHHQKQRECPPFFGYGYGFFSSYTMSMFRVYTGPALPVEGAKEVLEDPYYQWLERIEWPLQWVTLGILWLTCGWSVMLWAGLLRWVLNINGFWLVGYVSHCVGYVTYPLPHQAEQGRNNLLFGWLSFGEGWHNNHHAFPRSAQTGFRWWEFDVTYWTLLGLQATGLIHKIHTPPPEELKH